MHAAPIFVISISSIICACRETAAEESGGVGPDRRYGMEEAEGVEEAEVICRRTMTSFLRLRFLRGFRAKEKRRHPGKPFHRRPLIPRPCVSGVLLRPLTPGGTVELEEEEEKEEEEEEEKKSGFNRHQG